MKKIVSLLLATAVILTSNTLSVHAETKQENLPDSEVVEEFNVFNTDVIETTEEIPDIQTRSHITYKVTKLNRTSEIGAYTGQSVSGEPGVTISLAKIIHMYMLTTIRFFGIVLLKGGNVYVT